jgi:hypothetical protein
MPTKRDVDVNEVLQDLIAEICDSSDTEAKEMVAEISGSLNRLVHRERKAKGSR